MAHLALAKVNEARCKTSVRQRAVHFLLAKLSFQPLTRHQAKPAPNSGRSFNREVIHYDEA